VSSLIYTGLYHFNLIDIEKAYEKASSHYKGVTEAQMKARTTEFFMDEIRHRIQPGATKALETHKQMAHKLVLLSTSSSYQAELAANSWGLDHWIANRFPTKDGILDGSVAKPLCYGKGKVYWAEKWAEQHGISLKDSYFYTDSFSDLPMLLMVGHPRIVNPDPKLRRYAEKAKWQILDWS
jgi:HAD superfamily hydrolase (TIGR01490 family)